jgi:hypothetical protein
VAAACALLVIAVVLLASVLSGYPTTDLVRDPSSVTDSRWWNGGAAMLNATLWGVAAALGGFVAWMHPTHRAGMLLYTALSLMLMFEDTFQIKDLTQRVVPGELPMLVVYAVTGLACAWLLRPARTGLAGWTLIVAGVLLAVSLVVDQMRGGRYPSLILLEFGPMFVGTAVWASVPVLLHQQLVRAETHAGTG